jgi:hypothetical protein
MEEEDNDYIVDYYDDEYDGAGNDSDRICLLLIRIFIRRGRRLNIKIV